jgi:ADYC domain-containing protein
MWLLGVAGLSACVSPPVTQVLLQETSSCPSWGCGGNSPVIGPFEFHELEEHGALNDANMSLVGFRLNGVPYQPHVEGDKLLALDLNTGVPVFSGPDLKGGIFEVLLPGTGPAETRRAEIQITQVSNDVTFWLGPSDPVETYELQYTGSDVPPGAFRPLCKDPPPVRDGEGQTNVARFQTILFTGDRYKASTKEVTASTFEASTGWFNFACAGSAIAKLHLNRHTTASATAGFTTTADQRQAMLKMYTGDFCGTGEALTQQGTRIHWINALGWSSPPGNATTYESLWTSSGATCLTTHRLKGLSPIDYQGMIQGTSGSRGRCPKRPCAGVPGFPRLTGSGAYILTQSPALP